jgi:hypothetical protein
MERVVVGTGCAADSAKLVRRSGNSTLLFGPVFNIYVLWINLIIYLHLYSMVLVWNIFSKYDREIRLEVQFKIFLENKL